MAITVEPEFFDECDHCPFFSAEVCESYSLDGCRTVYVTCESQRKCQYIRDRLDEKKTSPEKDEA